MGKFVPHAEVRDSEWDIFENDDGRYTYEQVRVAVLLDIREELKRLNTLLHCSNFVGIPTTLRSIQRKLPAKPSRPKRKAVK